MRMRGHAQHDPAEYVPREMFEYWKKRDPLELYVKYLDENKLWDTKTRTEIEARIDRELTEDLAVAESAPFPPPELATQGVYCDGCHTIEAQWKRPKEEVMPPKSSVEPVWKMVNVGGMASGEARVVAAAELQAAQGNGSRAPAAKKNSPKSAQRMKVSGKKNSARKVRA
jgi:hypothetical protein